MNSAMLAYPLASPIASMLRHSPIPDLRRLHVEEDDFEVILTGNVASYYLKQLAQETIRGAMGDRRLRNRVIVARHRA